MKNKIIKEYEREEKFKKNSLIKRQPLDKRYLFLLRRATFEKNKFLRWYYERRLVRMGEKYNIEISSHCKIGKGLYLGHPGCITINPAAQLGEYVCLHKGATIGVENRGPLKGVPTIGNCVWIGINSIIFGKVTIGNDVLISPNTVVNRDIPDHSVVFGNPCQIRHRSRATQGYISDAIYERYFGDGEKSNSNKL